MRMLLLLLVISVGREACAETSNKNLHGEDTGLALLPGQGLSTVDWEAKGFCVDLGEMRTQSGQEQGQYAEFRMLEITSESSLRENLNISAAGMLKSSVFFKINARVNFARSVNKNSSSRYLLVHVRVANQMLLAGGFTFRPNAIDLLKTGRTEDFVASCGNEFVYGQRTGGELFALFEFEFYSGARERLFDAAVASSGLVWKAAADIENSVNVFSQLGATQIKIFRRGGRGKIPEIKSLVNLAREFANVVSLLEKNFVTLDLVSKNYAGVEPINLVTGSTAMLRQDLIVQQLARNNDQAIEMMNTIAYVKNHSHNFEHVDYVYLDATEKIIRQFININNEHVVACFDDIFNGCKMPEIVIPAFKAPRKIRASSPMCADGFSWSEAHQACCQTLKSVACQLDIGSGLCLLNRLKTTTECQEGT